MFEPSGNARVFALPPGVDFPKALAAGLRMRFEGQPPEALARVTLLVNTRRMQRRLTELFDDGPGLLLPRIRLITELAQDARFSDIPPAVSPLRRRLELAELVGQLLAAQPNLAPRAATFDLAESLAALMDEMQGEGVDPETIRNLDVSDLSGHWQRSLTFIDVIARFFGAESEEPPDAEARQRQVVEHLVQDWRAAPPDHPIILAGSTGSRGATQLLMQAVAHLPQGAVVLPGFDTDMPEAVWASLSDAMTAEDHPQFRFARLLQAMDMRPADVRPWTTEAPACAPRNALISLALRPAPVTDQWRVDGPQLSDMMGATADMTLIEAPSPRDEATAIALILREAAETGKRAALITPDRMLTRQVTAALDRWGIVPDDSAGRPLPLTAPGRFLRQVVDLAGSKVTSPALLALLKHPLTNTGSNQRGDHLRHTRDLELDSLRRGTPFPSAETLAKWAEKREDRQEWCAWIVSILAEFEKNEARPLSDHVAQTLALSTRISGGPNTEGNGELWEKPAGQEARRIMDDLSQEAPYGGDYTARDYRDLLDAVLNRGEVRDTVTAHPDVMIWGTLEARVQGVDVAVLAGLNEGSWPERPAPDPWMNRAMRDRAGLLLPERRIGLSAHDFQQAAAAPTVVLTRAIRDAESETVPSRWLNRLTNLLAGLPENGVDALANMRARGQHWVSLVKSLEAVEPAAPAPRPAPRPPEDTRPKKLSVTRVAKLIRDPYAIYAEAVLGLRKLRPLNAEPDAATRGTIIHGVLEEFVSNTPENELLDDARARLLGIAKAALEREAPWPAARTLWLARFARVVDTFLSGESARQALASPAKTEAKGRLTFGAADFTLTGTADRIDRSPDGALFIYDYKTGQVPTPKQQMQFDKQLLLEAVMAEAGAFDGLAPTKVAGVAYVGLGATPRFDPIAVDPALVEETREGFLELIRRYQSRVQGYASRRTVERQGFEGDYDHLARFGEWDHGTWPTPEEVGE